MSQYDVIVKSTTAAADSKSFKSVLLPVNGSGPEQNQAWCLFLSTVLVSPLQLPQAGEGEGS